MFVMLVDTDLFVTPYNMSLLKIMPSLVPQSISRAKKTLDSQTGNPRIFKGTLLL